MYYASFNMEWKIVDRVLHGCYESKDDIPKEIFDLADQYEGVIPGRMGWNIPFSFLNQQSDIYSKKIIKMYGKNAEYLVVYPKQDRQTKEHELLHAKYAMNKTYRDEVKMLWNSLTKREKIRVHRLLCHLHYPDDPNIQLDEFQAYYYTEKPNFFGISVNISSQENNSHKKMKKERKNRKK